MVLQQSNFLHRCLPCPSCSRTFKARPHLVQHQKSKAHCFCKEHQLLFNCENTFNKHIKTIPHASCFECAICTRSFRSDHALEDHSKSTSHKEKAKAAAQKKSREVADALALLKEEKLLRCDLCKRSFKNAMAWHRHKTSVKHNPISELKCPFSADCKRVFTTPSALLLHLESGKCVSGIDRRRVNAAVFEHDTERQITSAKGHQAFQPNDLSASHQDALTLSSSFVRIGSRSPSIAASEWVSVDDQDTLSIDSDITEAQHTPQEISHPHLEPDWVLVSPKGCHSTNTPPLQVELNGDKKHTSCPLCNKNFRNSKDLRQHCNSAAHDPRIFHYPAHLDLRKVRGTKLPMFKTLSGLLQRIESQMSKGGLEMIRQVAAICEREIRVNFGLDMKLLL